MFTVLYVVIRYLGDWKVVAFSAVLYLLLVAIQRVYFHPLANVPGPKIAAITYLYHSYWQVYKNGMFIFKLPELHKIYGPVVRITPDEVEIGLEAAVELYPRIMERKSKFYRDAKMVESFGVSKALAFLSDPVEAHQRRVLFNPMFSKKSINAVCDNIVYNVVEKLCGILDKSCGKPVHMANAFYCVTVDIITAFAFGECWDMLDEPGFESEWLDSTHALAEIAQISIHFPFVRVLGQIVGNIFPKTLPIAFIKAQMISYKLARRAIAKAAASKASGGIDTAARPKTIYEALLSPTNNKEHVRIRERDLAEETQVFLNAGSDTTANMMVYAIWHFLTKNGVKEKLLAEIDGVERDENGRFPLHKLEALPYFSGFVKETFRFNHGLVSRNSRLVPKGGLLVPCTNIHLPEGTRIALSIISIHNDPTIFPEPESFKPERWFGQKGKELERWLLTFGKGDRSCIGINLANAELHLVIAELLSKYEIKVWNTTEEDMEWCDTGAVRPKGRFQVILEKRA